MDIEPDAATEFLENIRFYGTRAKDCDGSGFFVFLENLKELRAGQCFRQSCLSLGSLLTKLLLLLASESLGDFTISGRQREGVSFIPDAKSYAEGFASLLDGAGISFRFGHKHSLFKY